MHAHARPILLALALLLLTGCQNAFTPTSLSPPYTPIDQVRADELMPLPLPAGIVRVTNDQGEHDQPDTTEPIAENTWRMRVADFWSVDLMREPTGALSILSEVELAEGQRAEYDPSLPMLPDTLSLDQPLHTTTHLHLFNHKTDTHYASGQCTQTITLLGTKQIQTPAGQTTAVIVQTDRQYKLPLVRIDVHILTAFVPGQGPAAGINRRIIKFLGLVPVTVEQQMLRIK